MIESMVLLSFFFGVFTGCLVSLVVGGIWVKRKLDSMKKSGGQAVEEMMGDMIENMPEPDEMMSDFEEENDEGDSSDK